MIDALISRIRLLLNRLPWKGLVWVGIFLFCAGCRQGMYDHSRYKPLERSEFFDEQPLARPLVAGTVPRGFLNTDEAFFTGKADDLLVESFPFPVNLQVLQRGRERYDIHCAVCHSRTGDGDGMIVQRGFPSPPSYHTERLRRAPVGHFFDVMTHGYGAMPSYASRVSPEDRWAIAAFIRVLQFSRHAPLEQLPSEERNHLEAIQ